MNSSVGLVYAGFPAMAGSVNQYAMYQQVRICRFMYYAHFFTVVQSVYIVITLIM